MKWETVVINGNEVSVAFDENSIHVYNAYPIKDNLKLRGYRWNPVDRSWFAKPDDVSREIEILKNNLSLSTTKKKNGREVELSQYPNSFSVLEFRNRLDRLLKEGIRGRVWLRGVIASEMKHYKWASFFDLKDEDENFKLYFRMEVKKDNLLRIEKKLQESGIAQTLEKDLPVFCQVEVFLPLRNVVDIRLSLVDLLPEYTQSKIRNQRDITLEALSAEGILKNQKTLILPRLISRIGLITSEQGTSIKDINAALYPYNNKFHFYFIDSRMEGVHAVDNIIKAISFLETHPDISVDLIIIARGGGSEQSLAVFNDLSLCRRVCKTGIPIITAIGHEKDMTAIEYCSWLTPSPSTPSGIGKFLQSYYMLLQEHLHENITRCIQHFIDVHHKEMEKLKGFLKNIPVHGLKYLDLREERFYALIRNLEQSVSFGLRQQEHQIRRLLGQLGESYLKLNSNQRNRIGELTSLVKFKANHLVQLEFGQLQKTILKLDFQKRYKENKKEVTDVLKNIHSALGFTKKILKNCHSDLVNKLQLVRAIEPEQILKRGFTLTLDDQHHVIKSVREFNQKEKAMLKFHDGSSPIKHIKMEKKKSLILEEK
jgi:exodeoxyribonuclease VII large subunit